MINIIEKSEKVTFEVLSQQVNNDRKFRFTVGRLTLADNLAIIDSFGQG